MNIALATDLRIAADTARFGLFEVKRGLIAAGGGLLRLPRKIPQNVAMEIAIVGTAALREATNAAAFREPAEQILGDRKSVV